MMCNLSQDCGQNAVCINGSCQCEEGFMQYAQTKDCIDASCAVAPGCLECKDGACVRCVGYLDQATGYCVESCRGYSYLVIGADYKGFVCEGSGIKSGHLRASILAILMGSGFGLLTLVVVAWIYHYRVNKTRGRFSLAHEKYRPRVQLTGYRNKEQGQIPYLSCVSKELSLSCSAQREQLLKLLKILHPNINIIYAMLEEAKTKYDNLDPSDESVPAFRNVYHSLSQVLELLTQPRRLSSSPSHGLTLLQWMYRLLREYIHNQQRIQGMVDVLHEEDTENNKEHPTIDISPGHCFYMFTPSSKFTVPRHCLSLRLEDEPLEPLDV